MERKERILRCLEENGVTVNSQGNLMEVNSLSFISTIVDIEQEFDIEIPDEYLLVNVLSNIEQINAIIELQVNKSVGI